MTTSSTPKTPTFSTPVGTRVRIIASGAGAVHTGMIGTILRGAAMIGNEKALRIETPGASRVFETCAYYFPEDLEIVEENAPEVALGDSGFSSLVPVGHVIDVDPAPTYSALPALEVGAIAKVVAPIAGFEGRIGVVLEEQTIEGRPIASSDLVRLKLDNRAEGYLFSATEIEVIAAAKDVRA